MNPPNLNIQVHLYAGLSRHVAEETAQGPLRIQVRGGSGVKDLLAHLKIPPIEVKLIFVNGVRAEMDTLLKDGDRVGIFPAVGGG